MTQEVVFGERRIFRAWMSCVFEERKILTIGNRRSADPKSIDADLVLRSRVTSAFSIAHHKDTSWHCYRVHEFQSGGRVTLLHPRCNVFLSRDSRGFLLARFQVFDASSSH